MRMTSVIIYPHLMLLQTKYDFLLLNTHRKKYLKFFNCFFAHTMNVNRV